MNPESKYAIRKSKINEIMSSYMVFTYHKQDVCPITKYIIATKKIPY